MALEVWQFAGYCEVEGRYSKIKEELAAPDMDQGRLCAPGVCSSVVCVFLQGSVQLGVLSRFTWSV